MASDLTVMTRPVDTDAISTAADRARIVLQMADARMNEMEGSDGKDDVFLVTYAIVLGHLAAIEQLCRAADEPADLPAAWAEIEAIQPVNGEDIPDQNAERRQQLEERIVRARPADLGGLTVQVKYLADVLSGSDPNEDDLAMLAHVVDQLEALTAQQAA